MAKMRDLCWVDDRKEGPFYVLALFFSALEVMEMVLGVGYVCGFQMMKK